MIEDTFKGESEIKRIGGKLYEDYLAFKKDVFYLNIYYFEFFSLLGMTDNVDCIIEALQSHKVKEVFLEKTAKDIDDGRLPRERYISRPTVLFAKKYALSEPEKVRKREENSININLRNKYKKIGDSYLKEKKIYPFYPKHNHLLMEVCGGAFYITPTQFAIDCKKFIEIYGNYLSASVSESGKLHKQAADAMNQFFNGVEITQVELKNYFILKDGVVKVNPKSMKIECYSRLGWRNCK